MRNFSWNQWYTIANKTNGVPIYNLHTYPQKKPARFHVEEHDEPDHTIPKIARQLCPSPREFYRPSRLVARSLFWVLRTQRLTEHRYRSPGSTQGGEPER